MSPSAKPINAWKRVLQELEKALKKIDESAKIIYYSLILEIAQDGYVAPQDVYISNAEYVLKFLTKVSKFFPQCKPRKEKTLHQSSCHLIHIDR